MRDRGRCYATLDEIQLVRLGRRIASVYYSNTSYKCLLSFLGKFVGFLALYCAKKKMNTLIPSALTTCPKRM